MYSRAEQKTQNVSEHKEVKVPSGIAPRLGMKQM